MTPMVEQPVRSTADSGRAADHTYPDHDHDHDHDHAMIDYALRRVGHGGGPDKGIPTRFDMTARELSAA
ncbi:hypothetical protein CH253_17555 [Rhodococcus sp. 06-156-3C]|uniref:hypothetical protein n=1 Tax=Nocardiaceae TaxID=85025 RepID=UPI000522F111|nr:MULTISPECIES: hypothetical protein [Rhodococcus]OZD18274.1 hypothetical protein CH280_06880 [Rhodococcus sp. 06-156-4C]OZD18872.1 hypothetical protein CH253_17555 [Rhodococcus sp. 06-156-3C]OZD22382.1 hypothetical protein CH248_09140 [Rhodococcus sp. 06-156-4a]OZD33966.1 hypothetical protein CH247_07670 [Rhodococcus sp. 06-156-3b]OZD38703.1 hypothetical protein CH284_06090 [Rhodococcus sp. 06-156-3]